MFDLDERDRIRLSRFIEETYGIKMTVQKKELLQARLQKRAQKYGFKELKPYIDFLFTPQGREVELSHFAAVISTHKTDFFREISHFDFIRHHLLPEWTQSSGLGTRETLAIWSAASSTGEEIYSIAMTVDFFFRQQGIKEPLYKVIGTDISEDISLIARRGIYPLASIHTIPVEYRHYLMHAKDPKRKEVRVVPEIRSRTDFRQQNLMDTHYKVKPGLHAIFCRNVLIYFDRPTQEAILQRLLTFLASGGYLFIGHSESITGLNLNVRQVAPTVYRKGE